MWQFDPIIELALLPWLLKRGSNGQNTLKGTLAVPNTPWTLWEKKLHKDCSRLLWLLQVQP